MPLLGKAKSLNLPAHLVDSSTITRCFWGNRHLGSGSSHKGHLVPISQPLSQQGISCNSPVGRSAYPANRWTIFPGLSLRQQYEYCWLVAKKPRNLGTGYPRECQDFQLLIAMQKWGASWNVEWVIVVQVNTLAHCLPKRNYRHRSLTTNGRISRMWWQRGKSALHREKVWLAVRNAGSRGYVLQM